MAKIVVEGHVIDLSIERAKEVEAFKQKAKAAWHQEWLEHRRLHIRALMIILGDALIEMEGGGI